MAEPSTTLKRNSGRNGRRRGTAHEAWLHGTLRQHEWRHGKPIGQGGEMPSPPEWFTASMHAIWRDLLARAPAGLLHPVDHGLLVGLTVAMDRHRCLACEVAGLMTLDPPGRVSVELDRALRLALASVLQVSSALGLTPTLRARTGQETPTNPLVGFVLLEPGTA
jgi:hypothetical protein